MSMPVFDVALEIAKLGCSPAISAIPAIRQEEDSRKCNESRPCLRIVPTVAQKNSRNSNTSRQCPSDRHHVHAVIPNGSDLIGCDLEWITWAADINDPDFEVRWAAHDLADLCCRYGLRVVRAGKRILIVYPALEPELVAYASSLLTEAWDYMAANEDRLPTLTSAEAVVGIKNIMRQHKGLRFCRGEGGSLWPIYPTDWTAEQRIVVQTLWFVAGEALDKDDFVEVDQ